MTHSRFLSLLFFALFACAMPAQKAAPSAASGAAQAAPQSAAQSAPSSAARTAKPSAPSSAAKSAPAAGRAKMSEAEKIEALLSGVEKSNELRFIRNGKEYDGAAAGK